MALYQTKRVDVMEITSTVDGKTIYGVVRHASASDSSFR